MTFWIKSDETLMNRVQTRADEAAFAELVHRWQPRLESLAYRMLHDRHRSQDLVQETFSRLFAKRHQYRSQAAFSSYIWRIIVNGCQDELRKRRSQSQWFAEETAEESPLAPLHQECTPAVETEKNEEAAVVRRALATLPDPIRIIVVMRHYEDLKFREIAEVLGIPEGTVKTRMAQGLNLLAKQLNPILSGAPASPVTRTSKQAAL